MYDSPSGGTSQRLLRHAFRVVTIPAADWDRFEAWAAAPARDIPALKELAATRPAWQD